MAFVEFRDVRKVYAMGEVEVAAVDGMTFDVERGEFVVVVGPSGAGKTTLLNMLGGMDVPTSGSILLDGRDVSAFSAKAADALPPLRHRLRVPVLQPGAEPDGAGERGAGQPDLQGPAATADDVLRAGGPGRSGGTTSPRSSPAASSSAWPSPGRWPRTPSCCSRDEPTGALDYQTGKAILKLLQDTCRATGKTVVRHHAQRRRSRDIADRVIHIREGRVAGVECNDRPLSADVLEW